MTLKVRIEDVATAAGVSIKTVSRVLNREPNVREETRARVQHAVDKLKYTPSTSARSLAGNKSYLIALLYNNPSPHYMMEIMGGVLEACNIWQYNMVLCPLEIDEIKLLASFDTLMSRSKPDGVVLTPPITDSPTLLKRLAELGLPYACISPKQQARMGADMNETRAAADMVEHLVSLGHHRIAHIIGHTAHGASVWRLSGYRQGLENAGLRFAPELVVPGEFSFESGVLAAQQLFSLDKRPTAVFAANDDMAAGVIRVALERNLRVPEDVSVCGFDDSPMSQQTFPALTTVHQPIRDMGRLSTLELLASLNTPESGHMLHIPYSLKVRQSTGPAPKSTDDLAGPATSG
jgi:LacI family transcriptional regulator